MRSYARCRRQTGPEPYLHQWGIPPTRAGALSTAPHEGPAACQRNAVCTRPLDAVVGRQNPLVTGFCREHAASPRASLLHRDR
jgi:hypothetical protein